MTEPEAITGLKKAVKAASTSNDLLDAQMIARLRLQGREVYILDPKGASLRDLAEREEFGP